MKNQLRLCYLLFFILLPLLTFSQDTLDLISNPSFEDEPRRGEYYQNKISAERNKIDGWYDCGILKFISESAPDIHGEGYKYWKNQHPPSDGDTYLGLVVRDNFSWESVGQRLSEDIQSGYCYTFTIDISMSNSYVSGSRLHKDSKSKYSYNYPSVLSIWAGDNFCDKKELLFETTPIDHEEWRTYEIEFQTFTDMQYITFEAYYNDGDKAMNGNILLDNITPFVKRLCDD